MVNSILDGPKYTSFNPSTISDQIRDLASSQSDWDGDRGDKVSQRTIEIAILINNKMAKKFFNHIEFFVSENGSLMLCYNDGHNDLEFDIRYSGKVLFTHEYFGLPLKYEETSKTKKIERIVLNFLEKECEFSDLSGPDITTPLRGNSPKNQRSRVAFLTYRQENELHLDNAVEFQLLIQNAQQKTGRRFANI